MKTLTYPVPHRARVSTPHGYITQPWTHEDVAFALSGGARFENGKHEFASVAARDLAIDGKE